MSSLQSSITSINNDLSDKIDEVGSSSSSHGYIYYRKGNNNTNVPLYGLRNIGRIQSLNFDLSDDHSAMFLYLSSNQTTEGKPSEDGFILTFSWDNSYYGAQLFIQANSNPVMQYRGCSNNGTWSEWKTVLDSSNISSYLNTFMQTYNKTDN